MPHVYQRFPVCGASSHYTHRYTRRSDCPVWKKLAYWINTDAVALTKLQTTMNNKKTARVHWVFWTICAVALIWNVLGCINFMIQLNVDMVASLPERHRAVIESRPLWATLGFAIGVFGGAFGSLALLLRMPLAYYGFIASLLGLIVTMIHTVHIVVLMIIVNPLLVASFLVWFTRRATNKGWIN
jgi:hypothetical protein